MKFSILTFFLTFAACVYAVAIALPEDLEREAIRAIQSGDIVPVEHPDSRQELQVYENGVLQGTVVVTQEGEVVRAFDADGNEISAAELDVEEADARTIQKRWITLAFRAAWLIGKYAAKGGKLFKRLKNFAVCVGYENFINCASEWQGCIQLGTIEQKCFKGLHCLGTKGWTCAKRHI
ncbi:hypothetical protein IWW34DRAFT_872733 [Fusarium oxysporum f. sp. albedinis]|nr:hypothetical protein IWW34DRAFT_872733 [Fusarium oxysporum f. sp. albedinis]